MPKFIIKVENTNKNGLKIEVDKTGFNDVEIIGMIEAIKYEILKKLK